MSLTFEVLGGPDQDNALLVRLDSGQSITRLLFDCGEGCLRRVPAGDLLGLDHLFFSHLHMDHVGGFDTFFRLLYQRNTKPNHLWGPPETRRILQHRLQGFMWNLHDSMQATWHICDIHPERLESARFELSEAFAVAHPAPSRGYERVILDEPAFTVEALTMDHQTPVIAYLVREKARSNLDPEKLAALGLAPGPWMQLLKSNPAGLAGVEIQGRSYQIAWLREQLLVTTGGASIACLTDFLLDDNAAGRLEVFLQGCQTLVCESQYRAADLSLAQRHFHMITTQAAQLAQRVQPQRLILIHLSSRYQEADWLEMLEEARSIFPATEFPAGWNLPNRSGNGV
jgi:ribonuclease Z